MEKKSPWQPRVKVEKLDIASVDDVEEPANAPVRRTRGRRNITKTKDASTKKTGGKKSKK